MANNIGSVTEVPIAVGRPMPRLVFSEVVIKKLQILAGSRSLPHSIVQCAQIVLGCGACEGNTAIAKRMGLTGMTSATGGSATGSWVGRPA